MTDRGANNTYTFTATTLLPEESVAIASGGAIGDVTWKQENVWNNDSDTAHLYDGSGRLVSQRGVET